MVVVGVQYLHDISGQVLLLHSLLVISLVKGIQLEAHHRLRVPDPQGVHNMVAIAHDRQVKGNGIHGLVTRLRKMISAVLVPGYSHIAADFNLFLIFGPAQFEGIAIHQPVVRHFNLISVLDLLLEHTIAVANAAAGGGITQGSQRVQKACRQTT